MAYAMFGKPSEVYDVGGQQYTADATGKISDVADLNHRARLRDAGCLDNDPILAASSAGGVGAVLSVATRTGNVVLSKTDISGLGTAASLALIAGFAKHALIAGGAAGNFTVTGIKTTDTLNMVLQFVGAATTVTNVADLTSEFTITALNTINNTAGTASTGDKLLVLWTATT